MLSQKMFAILLLVFLTSLRAVAQNETQTNSQSSGGTETSRRAIERPVLTGAISFDSHFEPGSQEIHPVIAPVLLVPVINKALIEAEFEGEIDAVRQGGNFQPWTPEKSLEYAQIDYFLTKNITVVGGRFLTPFGIYKERLDPRWIRNIADEPFIFSFEGSSSNGAMVRGAVPLSPSANLTYSTYFSATTKGELVAADRQAGFRTALVLPARHVELGFSFQRKLGEGGLDTYGADATWNLHKVPLDLRAEALMGHSIGVGYWTEAAWRLSSPALPRVLRKAQAVTRVEQFLVPRSPSETFFGELPTSNSTRSYLGFTYDVNNAVRVTGAYGYQFSADGNHNIFTLGISYRFIY